MQCFTTTGIVRRLTYKLDDRINNCGVFKIQKEDHTLGNLVTQSLLRDHRVIFAGYRIPHPYATWHMDMRVRTDAKYKTDPLKVHCLFLSIMALIAAARRFRSHNDGPFFLGNFGAFRQCKAQLIIEF